MKAPFLSLRSAAAIATVLTFGGLNAAGQNLPTLYVNARTGCDAPANPGTSPAAPLETITRELQIASANASAPRTIMVAGVVGGLPVQMPYDEIPSNPPNQGCGFSNGECFPLALVPAVTLLWDEANSDEYPTEPPSGIRARPLVRLTSAFLPGGAPGVLVQINGTPPACGYVPPGPAAAVTVQGLDFEGGNPAIDVDDGAGGLTQVSLVDLRIRNGLRGIRIRTDGGEIAPTIDACVLDRTGGPSPPPPWMAGVLQDGLILLEPTQGGTISGVIENCALRALGAAGTDRSTQAGVRCYLSDGTGILTTGVTNCVFEGSVALGGTPNGLFTGIDLGLEHPAPSVQYPGRFSFGVSGCSFTRCAYQGFGIITNSAAGTTTVGIGSRLMVSSCTFTETGAGFTSTGSGGQIAVDTGFGHRISLNVVGNQISGGPRDGVHVRASSAGPLVPEAPGIITLNIINNVISGHGGDGIEYAAYDTQLGGMVSGNRIFGNGDDGIEIIASAIGQVPTTVAPDVVNNMIGPNNGGHGIHVVIGGSFAATQVIPRIVFNSVYGSGGYGLKLDGTPLPVFQVWNCIFDQSAGFLPDIDIIELSESNISWTRFGGSTGANGNTNATPGFVNPALGDLSLQSGSFMIDMASTSPPVVPATDFFGNLRLRDVGPTGPNYADKGAHERTSP